ncbi:hypothetical protein chiPu_0008761 [Chiloscyllium punctatum]|uniref:Uncharacterized protein n=1 Tax=Chiloscyllium punctatum TaxID=137246 RepID=A0A401SIY9_CHIPU|nr:hypothetical protein [Chiloscyllium punctatum]
MCAGGGVTVVDSHCHILKVNSSGHVWTKLHSGASSLTIAGKTAGGARPDIWIKMDGEGSNLPENQDTDSQISPSPSDQPTDDGANKGIRAIPEQRKDATQAHKSIAKTLKTIAVPNACSPAYFVNCCSCANPSLIPHHVVDSIHAVAVLKILKTTV